MTAESYRNHPDYEILQDYHTPANCENYLRGLVTNPGCGVFLPDASFMCLDGHGTPCGYVICSRISDGRALIPQIATHPAWQGRGLGAALISRCTRNLQAMNFHSTSLMVTKGNSRAFEWYRRMGFQPHREFDAFIWNRF
jgi:ribosomal protein S18 acetylase RimI-like enzyme